MKYKKFFSLGLTENKTLLTAPCEEEQSCFMASYQHNRQPLETLLSLPKPGNPASWFCEQSSRSVWSEGTCKKGNRKREEKKKSKTEVFHHQPSSSLPELISARILVPGEALSREYDMLNISQGKQITQYETSVIFSHYKGFWRRGLFKIQNRRGRRQTSKTDKSQVRLKRRNQLQKLSRGTGRMEEEAHKYQLVKISLFCFASFNGLL